jgi:uncharacterized protein (TIGR02594 family)
VKQMNTEIDFSKLQGDDPWWLRKAFEELGEAEVPGKGANPKIIEFHKWTNLGATDDETPWCAAFMRWLFEEMGPGTARSFEQYGKPIADFKRGCIVVMSRPGATWTGHVALGLAEFKAKNGDEKILCLGGNQGDSVSVKAYPKSRLLAYRWPPGEVTNKQV